MSARRRVAEYLDAVDEHNEKTTLRYDDIMHQFNEHKLRRSDLRVLLDKLDTIEAILSPSRDITLGPGISGHPIREALVVVELDDWRNWGDGE